MRKNKLYLILAIITAVFLFATAAICNQCSSGEELTLEEETPHEEELPLEEELPEEEPPPAEAPLPEEEPPEEEPAEEELSAPTINLEIYEGPLYSEADEVCYYRVEAIVTGNPTPSVKFSKDDSFGTWGKRKCQINLESPSETYTLTATASSSEGEDSDSIEITWGCEEEPADGDVILEGPGLELELTPGLPFISLNPSHVGYAIKDDGVNNSELIIGDSINNQDVRGFFSFDVTPLAGKTIDSAKLVLKLPEGVGGFGRLGDPSFKGSIELIIRNYPIPLTPGDYYLPGILIIRKYFSNPEDPLEYSSLSLKNDIDLKSETGDLIGFIIDYDITDSDGDFKIDGRRYRKEDISLIVWYEE